MTRVTRGTVPQVSMLVTTQQNVAITHDFSEN